jgi:ubiquinone biosynthesis monooxygenase Coq7
VRIYEGQLAVLGGRPRAAKTAAAIRRMAEQERQHLEAFDRLINERRVRPTALEPVWRIAGYALGVATAMMGEKAAMACTAAVEEVIDEHYGRQLERLEGDPDSKIQWTDFAPMRSRIATKLSHMALKVRPAIVPQ